MISILLLSFLAMGDAHVHGVVRDSLSREPLVGAVVRVLGTNSGSVTDHHGSFHLHDVTADSIQLELRYVGYPHKRITLYAPYVGVVEVLMLERKRALFETQPVIVQAERMASAGLLSQAQSTLTETELRENSGQSFSGALADIAGVTTINTGPTVQKPIIRGQSGNRIVINNNGINQEGQQWGTEHAPEIDPFTPMRIHVIKGATGVVYGPNAMGGIIKTEPLPLSVHADASGEVSVNAFSNNSQGAVGGYVQGGRVLGEPLALRVYANVRRAGDSRAPTYTLQNTGFASWSAGLFSAFGDNSLGGTVSLSQFQTTLGIFAGSHIGNPSDMQRAIERGNPATNPEFSYDISNPKQEVQHTLLTTEIHNYIESVGTLSMTYGWQRNNRSEYDAHNTRIVGRGTDPVERAADSVARLNTALQTPAMNLVLNTYSVDARLDHKLTDLTTGSVGINALRQNNSRGGAVQLIPDYLLYGVGGYVLENSVFGNVQVSAGLRYDVRWLQAQMDVPGTTQQRQRDKLFTSYSGALGAQGQITDHVKLSANIGSAWRPPQVNELYSNGLHHGVATFEIGDTSLTAERNINADVTINVATQILRCEVSAYTTRYLGYIYTKPLPNQPTTTVRGTFPTYVYTSSNAWINGVDASFTAELTDVLSVSARGSVVRGTTTDGTPLPLMPSDRLRLSVHAHAHDVWIAHDAYAEVGVSGVRRQDHYLDASDYAPPPPGYVLGDVRLGATLDVLETPIFVGASCTNVFNIRYRDYLNRFRYFADEIGRNITVRFSVPFH